MYRAKAVEEALLHVVGWEQDVNPDLQIAGGLTESESGLTFQSAHPMCTLAMVNALVPSDWERSIKAWYQNDIIRKGEIRKHKNHYWKAKKNSQGQEPPYNDFNGDFNDDFGNEYWRVTNLLTEKTEQLTRRGIQNAVQRWMATKRVNKESRTLLEHRAFFDGAGRLQDTMPNQDKIVGFELEPVHGFGVTVKIDKVGLQFNSPGQVTLYVFHSGKSEPVYQQTVGYDRSNGTFKWFEPKDWYLPYLNEWGAGGSWYLVYVQRDNIPGDGVLMEAVRVSKDWNAEPCGGCNIGSVQAWRELLQYVKIHPMQASTPGNWDKSDPQRWNLANNAYTPFTNYGLNVMVSVQCDVTDLIIKNKQQFAPVIKLQTAYDILRNADMNPDVVVSRYQSNISHTDVRYELDGSAATHKKGMGIELDKEYAALEVETQGMDKVCLGCNNRGIRFRTA
ncbi:MAG: hypothetical protein J5799_04785 [Bacteroidales bacterium]|nr:hypothetical protein [Bacteroidales bacterium]MBR5920077.1 hypothetical protein [Bacteroidales bacterium]